MSSCRLVIEALEDDAVRVALDGELSGSSAYTLDDQLRKVEATGPRCLVLDLSGLTFIDSAGLARVLGAHRRAQRDGRRLLVIEGDSAIRRLLSLTALDRHLNLVPDARAALAAARN